MSCNLETESWSETCLSAEDRENSDPTGRTRCTLSSRERLLIALSTRSQLKMGKAARECSIITFSYPVTTYPWSNQLSLQSLMCVLKRKQRDNQTKRDKHIPPSQKGRQNKVEVTQSVTMNSDTPCGVVKQSPREKRSFRWTQTQSPLNLTPPRFS